MNVNRADSTILWRVLAAALVTLTLTGTTGVLSRSAAADPASDQQVFVRLINQTRARLSLPPLTVHPELTAAATAWTSTMVDNGQVTHSSNLGAGISEPWSLLGENVGVHSIDDPDELFQAFVNSPSHHANIVDPRFHHVGVGVIHGPDGKLWTTHRFMATHQSPTTTTLPTPTTTTSPPPAPSTSVPQPPVTSAPPPPSTAPTTLTVPTIPTVPTSPTVPTTTATPAPSTTRRTAPPTTATPTTAAPTTAQRTTEAPTVRRPTIPRATIPRATSPRATIPRATIPRATIPQTTASAPTIARKPAPITAQSATARRATGPGPIEGEDLNSDLDDQQRAELVQPDASTIETVLIDLLTAGI